jgi:hypothetical protein
MPEFKVGDRVYFPMMGVGVYLLNHTNSQEYPVGMDEITFTNCGQNVAGWQVPAIFHATPENQAALELLYGQKFEDAPKPVPVGSDLTRWLLAKHGKPVLCYVDDESDAIAVRYLMLRTVVDINENGLFIAGNGCKWRYAVPLPNTTDFTTAADYAD